MEIAPPKALYWPPNRPSHSAQAVPEGVASSISGQQTARLRFGLGELRHRQIRSVPAVESDKQDNLSS